MSKPKHKFSVLVSPDIAEQARNAAAFLAGHPAYLTLGALVEKALSTELERLRAEHTQGAPFPASGSVKRGRPVGSRALQKEPG